MKSATDVIWSTVRVIVGERIRRGEYDSVEAVESDVEHELSSIQCAVDVLLYKNVLALLMIIGGNYSEQLYRDCDAEEIKRRAVALFNATRT
jgi:muramoyltetrapeptide carboxypeptidase LdcA involved in peptidoglycan recycling